MTLSWPSFLCAMVTGGSMLTTRHAYALLTRLLKSLNELFNLQHILLMCGFTIVVWACPHSKILMMSEGNMSTNKRLDFIMIKIGI